METFNYNEKTFYVKCAQYGQRRPYGDRHYNYEVTCDSATSCDEVLAMARANPRMDTSSQDYKDWGTDKGDDVYFRGFTQVSQLVNREDGSFAGYAVETTIPYTG